MNQPGALNEKYKKVFVVSQKQKSKELLYFYHEIEIYEIFFIFYQNRNSGTPS